MTWFTKNTIDWKASDAKIQKGYLELAGEALNLENRMNFQTDEFYLHDAIYPDCNCVPDLLADEADYRELHRVLEGAN